MKYFFAFILISSLWFSVNAQDFLGKKCGTVEAINQALEQNPGLIKNLEKLDQETKEYLMGHDKALDSTLTVPVVFHVIHTYGSERISEAQIRDCMRIINEDFQNKNADSNSVSAPFRPIVGRPQIRFRLAKKSPTGKCTKGINYLESSLHTAGGENLKTLISWDTKKYLNIWVCSDIASGAAAYAFYPGTAPSQNNEGIVSRDDYVGSIGTSSPGYSARTLTHELGHYFNLPHTWGNSNEPGLASNCNIDDGVADTPLCVGVTGSGCNLNQISCGSLDNVENHMEYSSCRRMFTQGQATRIQAAINSSVGFRSSLWKGANLIATGTTNDGPGPECPPTPDFKSSLRRACPGQAITFTQLAYNVNDQNAIGFQWSFIGGNPAFSVEKNPTVIYSSPGSYPVKLKVTNTAGSDSVIRNAYIVIQPQNPGYQIGEIEGIESPTFPIQADTNKKWEIVNSGNTGWGRTLNASASGVASLRIINGNNFNGNVSTLFSPVYQINGPNTGARINFKYAFVRRNTTNNDRLLVTYSTNCGVSWTNLFNKTGSALATVTGTQTSLFTPSGSDWRQESLVMNFLGSATEFRLRFQFTGGGGNSIFLDDIMLSTTTSVSNLQDENLALQVVPNPSGEKLPSLWIETSEPEKARLEIWDVLGKNCSFHQEFQMVEGQNQVDLQNHIGKPKAGTYLIRLQLANRIMVRKWVVLP